MTECVPLNIPNSCWIPDSVKTMIQYIKKNCLWKIFFQSIQYYSDWFYVEYNITILLLYVLCGNILSLTFFLH